MEESEEKGKGFKVQDKRRFSAEGEARPDVEESEAAAAPESPKAEARPEPPPAAAHDEHEHHVEMNFSTFLVGLSTEALAALGEMPDPVTGKPMRSLGAARQLIDIIGMLRDKTRGNLDREEQNLIEAILFELRMKYVELAKPTVA
jgi:Domain of unknown function (DUF1844)